MLSQIRPALVTLTAMTLLTGFAYPLAMTGIAQAVFPDQANGSLVERDGAVIGSSLVAQAFTAPGYFHPRPSAANFDGGSSTGSNLGPTSEALKQRIADAVDALARENPGVPIPADLVTTSASGLDPEISPAAADFQAPRVAKARNMELAAVRSLIGRTTQRRTFGLLGEKRVNVLALNLALDDMTRLPSSTRPADSPVAQDMAPGR